MIRSLALWACLMAAAGWTLFHTSYRVVSLESKLAKINHEIAEETQGIQVLKAEWSYLNSPSHLQALVQGSNLPLKPTKAAQIASLDSIPQKESSDGTTTQLAALTPAPTPEIPKISQVSAAPMITPVSASRGSAIQNPQANAANLMLLLARVEKRNNRVPSQP